MIVCARELNSWGPSMATSVCGCSSYYPSPFITPEHRTPSRGHRNYVAWKHFGMRYQPQESHLCEPATAPGQAGPEEVTDRKSNVMEEYADSKTHPAGMKIPNAWGLYEMHGNVWEWCSDGWKRDYTTTAVSDPMGPAAGFFRALRDGGWGSRAGDCRSADRRRRAPVVRLNRALGVRLAFSSVD